MQKQRKLRTWSLTPNANKSFSVGTMLFIDEMYERLHLPAAIGRLKDKGVPMDALVKGMLTYKLGENFSILQASEWMNRPEVLEHYAVQGFNERTLYRAVELLGRDRTYHTQAPGPRPGAAGPAIDRCCHGLDQHRLLRRYGGARQVRLFKRPRPTRSR